MYSGRLHRAAQTLLAVVALGAAAATAVAQITDAPAASGIDPTLMRVQPLDNATPSPAFSGIWEPYVDGNWLSFDLDFTTGSADVEIVEARVRYLAADDTEITAVTVGSRDLSFAILSRTDAVSGAAAPAAFGETGGTLTDMGSFGSHCIRDIEIDNDGQLLAGGTGSSAPIFPAVGGFPDGSLVARYDTAGEPDNGFDGNGRVDVGFEHPFDDELAIRHGVNAITTDAQLDTWTGGLAWLEGVPQDGDVTSYWSVARLDVNGDPDFLQLLIDDTEGGQIRAIGRQGARLIAAGFIDVGGNPRATIAGLDLSGEVDPGFGLRIAGFLPDDSASTYTAIAFDSQDRLHAAGWFGPPQGLLDDETELEDRTWFLVRFQDDGFIDEDFGTDGIVEVDFTGFDRAYPSALAIDFEDRIVSVGSVSAGDGINSQATVARHLPSGAPDEEFQPLAVDEGRLVTDAGFTGLVSSTDVAIDGEDRIVVALGVSDLFAAMRLLGDDGDFDESFGDGGVAAHDHPDTTDQSGTFTTALDVASGNRPVLGGCATDDVTSERNFATVRLLESGGLDSNGAQIPPNTRVLLAFPDEALADGDRAMPFEGDPPVTVEVELDVRDLDDGDLWTLSWTEIVPATYTPVMFPDGSSYIFPLAPVEVNVPEPEEEDCEAAGEETPDPLELSYRISFGHELRFGAVETRHRHLVQTVGVPSASNDQRYAYDIVVRDQNGNGRAVVDGDCEPITEVTNTNSLVWGQQVVAVADGNIVFADNSQPTNPSPGVRLAGVPRGGNTITIDHGNGEFSRYSHMQASSIPSNIATFPCAMDKLCTVEQGDVIGRVGNSGNSSGPHLHFALLDGSNANTDEGRPVSFSNVSFDDMLQTNLGLHTGQILDGVLPAPGMLELNPASPPGIVAEAEVNDSLETHHALTPPTTVQGTISEAEAPTLAVRGDPVEDIYRIEATTRSQLVVSLTAAPAGADLDLYVLNDGLQMLNPDRAGWGPGGDESLTLTVPPGRYYVAVTDPENGSGKEYELDVDVRPFAWEYAAKIVCGDQPEPGDGRLARGTYATTVNIHNPGGTPALVYKKLALSFPPAEQLPGEILEIGEDTLGYDQAVKTDCGDIGRNVLTEGLPDEATYFEGFVVVQSTERLDVTAVYTSAALGPDGGPGAHSSIDVEQITERGLGVDLQIDKSAEVFIVTLGDLPIHLVLYTIEVSNLGPATATDVRIDDHLSLAVVEAVGAAGIFPAPLELPPTGSLISLEYPAPTESVAEFAIGDIAAGTTRTIRFWAAALARPEGRQAVALLTNRASIRAGEAELLGDDNFSITHTLILP